MIDKLRSVKGLYLFLFFITLLLMSFILLLPNQKNAEAKSIDEFRNSVVRILCMDVTGRMYTGTGFAIGLDKPVKHIVTNYHVIEPNLEDVHILITDNNRMKAKVIDYDQEKDIAILELTEELTNREPLEIGYVESVKPGQEVYALGFPGDADLIDDSPSGDPDDVSITKGIISKITTQEGRGIFQIDVSINPGNSGGPLINENGHVLGINTFTVTTATGINGAVRVDELIPMLDSLKIKYMTAEDQEQVDSSITNSKNTSSEENSFPFIWVIVIAGIALLIMMVGIILIMIWKKQRNDSQIHQKSPVITPNMNVEYKQDAVAQPKKKTAKWLWIGIGAGASLIIIISISAIFVVNHFILNNSNSTTTNDSPKDKQQQPHKDDDEPDDEEDIVINEVMVPNLINLNETEATTLLEQKGLILGMISYVESLYVNKGIVIKQSLQAEQNVNENEIIDIEVSKGIALPFDEESIKSQHLDIVYEYWDNGYNLNQDKDYIGALRLYIQARDMANILYKFDGNFDAQFAIGVLNRNISLMKRTLGYHAYALLDIQNSVVQLEELRAKDSIFQKNPKELGDSYGDLSYLQILNELPNEAVVSAQKAIDINSTSNLFIVNLAHAYLFSNNYEEAFQLYSQHKYDQVTDQVIFADFVLQDFDYFKELNITHPDMDKIIELYSNLDIEDASDEEEIIRTIEANADAMEIESVEEYMNTIDPQTPNYQVTVDITTDFFQNYDNIKVELQNIEFLEINENTANVKLEQFLTCTDGTNQLEAHTIFIHHLVRADENNNNDYKWLIHSTTEIQQ